jgi:rod shape-determining protein MreD
MTLLVAAIAATVTAIFELTITPYLRVGDAQPHVVFVFAVIWTVAAGLDSGLAWAFVGGVALDVLAERPLGVSSFALLITVGTTALLARALVRIRPLIAVLAAAPLSLVYSMTLIALFGILRPPFPVADPVGLLVPGAVYDVVLAAALGPLAVALHDRYTEEERVDW